MLSSQCDKCHVLQVKKVASTVRLHHYCNMSADCQTTY